ncbi:MAG TPA: hypothetical protein VMK13_11310 [Streptosporangiaceae bacterium]|nr:hypothetical protein [Streptosporangiaceae bacterium]
MHASSARDTAPPQGELPQAGQAPRRPGAEERAADAAQWIARLKAAQRACCCPAKPFMVALLPPRPGGTELVDIFLCGHHGRICRESLAAAGARLHQLPDVP